MNLTYKKTLGQFRKVLRIGEDPPPPHVGKISQIIPYLFYECLPNRFEGRFESAQWGKVDDEILGEG